MTKTCESYGKKKNIILNTILAIMCLAVVPVGVFLSGRSDKAGDVEEYISAENGSARKTDNRRSGIPGSRIREGMQLIL